MSKLILTFLVALGGLALYSAADPKPAYCSFCTSMPCFESSACSQGCVCMRSGPEPGTCVRFD